MNDIQLSTSGFLLFYLLNSQSLAEHAEGVVRVKSRYSVAETVEKLESVLKSRGMTIFKRVSHADGAAKIGLELRPTELMIFGDPELDAQLVKSQPLAALDLPQKALVFEDDNGVVWFAYNDPRYIARRHHIKGCDDVVNRIAQAMRDFAVAATQ